jgi:hypothetical protein
MSNSTKRGEIIIIQTPERVKGKSKLFVTHVKRAEPLDPALLRE